MRSRRLVVPVLFLAGIGWAAAHAVAHEAAMREPGAAPPEAEGYLGYFVTSTALCLVLALSLAAGSLAGRRRRDSSLRSLLLFGLVPLLGFAGHAAVEPTLAGGRAAPDLGAIAPVALVGLVVQIPFALVAMALAHRVFALAEGLARALPRPAGARERRPTVATVRLEALREPSAALALAHPGRGPPRLPA